MLLASFLSVEQDPAAGGAGPLGLLIIALLGIVTVLLIRNMRSRLRKLPPSFDPPPGDDDPQRPGSAGPR